MVDKPVGNLKEAILHIRIMRCNTVAFTKQHHFRPWTLPLVSNISNLTLIFKLVDIRYRL